MATIKGTAQYHDGTNDITELDKIRVNDLTTEEDILMEGNLFLGDSMLQPNGSATVTLTNIAPVGVTTATVARWMIVRSKAGTVYYVPMWT